MRHMQTQTLLNYWRRMRGEQLAPAKTSIVPRDIKKHLAFTFLLRSEGHDRFSFVLAGTGVCDLFGRELRGSSFGHLFAETSRDGATTSLVRTAHLSVPTVAACVAETADGRPLNAEILLLPFADERGETTYILGHFQSLEPLSRLYGRHLVRMRMGASAILTGDTPAVAEPGARDGRKAGAQLRLVSARP